MLIGIHLIILILLILSGTVYSNLSLVDTPSNAVYLLSLLSLILFLWQMWSWKKLSKEIFSPYPLFMLSSMLFNSGQAFLIVLGIQDGYFKGTFSNESIVKTLFLVILCHAFIHFGALIAWVTNKKDKVMEKKEYDDRHYKAISTIGWALFAISIVPTMMNFKDSLITVLNYGYLGIYRTEQAVGLENSSKLIATFVIPAVLFLLAGSKGKSRKRNIAVAVITISLYSLAGFFVGTRSGPILPLLAFAWVWHRCVQPIPKTFLVTVGSLFMFVIFPVVGLLRENTGGERFSLSAVTNAYISIDNPAVAIFNEMGNSMNTVAHTLTLIPFTRSYDLGVGYFYALTTAIPNLFWDLHPAVVHGKFANWLIWQVDPFIAKNGGGIGYSYISEAYANFGYLGAPIALFLFGLVLVKFFLWAEKAGDPARIAMVATFLAFLLFIARDESATIVRPLLWYSLIPYLGVFVIKKRVPRISKSIKNEVHMH